VTRDLTVCVVLVILAAFLGVFVHPLLWSVAVLALAWLVGRDPQTRRPRAK
jgi:type IV secretory pathway TrbD component